MRWKRSAICYSRMKILSNAKAAQSRNSKVARDSCLYKWNVRKLRDNANDELPF